jgi:hypothetical protein
MNPESTRPPSAGGVPASDLPRRTKSLAELAAEQGVTRPQTFETLFGAGADLWDDDAAFEAFLEDLRQSRQSGG